MNIVEFWTVFKAKFVNNLYLIVFVPFLIIVSVWLYLTYEYVLWDVQRDSKQKEVNRKIEDLNKLYATSKASFEGELSFIEQSIEKKKKDYDLLQKNISSQKAIIETQEEKIKIISDLNASISEKSAFKNKLNNEIQNLEKEKKLKYVSVKTLTDQISKLEQEKKTIYEAHSKALALNPIIEEYERKHKEIVLNTENAQKVLLSITEDISKRKQLINLASSIEGRQKELKSLEENIEFARTRFDSIKKNNENQIALLTKKIVEMTAKEGELKGKVALLVERLNESEAKRINMQEDINELISSLSEKKVKESELTSSISEKEAKLSKIELDLTSLIEKHEASKKSYENDIAKLRSDFLNNSKNLGSLQATSDHLSKSIIISNQTLDLTNKNIAANKAIILEQASQIENLKSKIKNLESEISQKKRELKTITTKGNK